jgi:hypothetical protein
MHSKKHLHGSIFSLPVVAATHTASTCFVFLCMSVFLFVFPRAAAVSSLLSSEQRQQQQQQDSFGNSAGGLD